MTDIIDEIIAVIEAEDEKLADGSPILPPSMCDGDQRAWGEIVKFALAEVVEQRWEAKAREKAKWAAARPGHWVWEDGLGKPTRGTDGEYWVFLQQWHGNVTVRVEKGGDVQGFACLTMTDAKVCAERHVAKLRAARQSWQPTEDTLTRDGAPGVGTVPTTSPAVGFYGGNVGAKVVKGE